MPEAKKDPRSRILLFALAVSAGTLLLPTAARAITIAGYARPSTLAQGDTLEICVSTDAPTFDLTFQRIGAATVNYLFVDDLPGVDQGVPDSSWSEGCAWEASYTLVVPQSWPSGIYVARLKPPGAARRFAIFTVREDEPGSTARILLQSATNTWQAYNNWGGKSLYPWNSTDGVESDFVSYDRPYAKSDGMGHFTDREEFFVKWVEGAGYDVEYCTDLDAHARPDLETHYDLLVVFGHSEYWSLPMRRNVEERIARGANTAFFTGNTCFWQVRLDSALTRMTCYKSAAQDPLTGVEDSVVTAEWALPPVSHPENLLTGLGFRNGGYVNHDGWYPDSLGYGDYTAWRTNHWVYEGTGLTDGEEFGYETTIVGHETDGALFEWIEGLPAVTGGDSTPATFVILATSVASYGHATMGVWTKSGATVFNSATTDWSHGLATDPVVDRITRNVLDRLLEAPTAVADGIEGPSGGAASGRRLRAFPNPANPSVRIEWQEAAGAGATAAGEIAIHAVDGRLVRRLPLAPGAAAVLWDGEDGGGRPMPSGVYFAVARERGSPTAEHAAAEGAVRFVLLR